MSCGEHQTLSDGECIAAWQLGDSGGAAELYRRYAGRLATYLRAHYSRAENDGLLDLHDIASEAWVRLLDWPKLRANSEHQFFTLLVRFARTAATHAVREWKYQRQSAQALSEGSAIITPDRPNEARRCKIKGCKGAVGKGATGDGRGMCSGHYSRWRRGFRGDRLNAPLGKPVAQRKGKGHGSGSGEIAAGESR